MTVHAVRLIGFPTDDPNVVAAPSGLDTTDLVTVVESDSVGIIDAVDDYMALTLTVDGVTPAAGDLVAVVGPVGDIPDYQRGMLFVSDGEKCHFANAGHLSAAFSQ